MKNRYQELDKELREALENKFQLIENNLNGSAVSHLKELRKNSLTFIKENGLPSRKNEDYKYTYVSREISPDLIRSITSVKDIGELTLPSYVGEDPANLIVFINGRISEEHTKITDRKLSLDNSGSYKKVGDLADYRTDPFIALNSALLRQPPVISIPDNYTVEEPLIIHHITTGDENTLSQPRLFIEAGENSEINIIESYQNNVRGNSLNNLVGEIFAHKAARVNIYKIQEESREASRIDNTNIYQEDNSFVNVFTFTFDGSTVRNNLNIILDGSHCEAHMYGLYLVKGKTHVDNHTSVDHRLPDSMSNELYKGILDENATGVFNGKIFVRQDAQKTNAFQTNKNILLTDTATINTKPQLEIWADDVKCSHGCTNGQLDEEQLFYLRTRGIDADHARAILLHAFAADVLSNIKYEKLKDYLDHRITEQMY